MKESDLRPAPPVPPRRLKRKNKPIVSSMDVVSEVTTPTFAPRPERRPRLPPPPPPQRGLPRPETRPQLPPRGSMNVVGKEIPSRIPTVTESCQSIPFDKPSINIVAPTRLPRPAEIPASETVIVVGRGKKHSNKEPDGPQTSLSTFGTVGPLISRNSAEKPRPKEAPRRHHREKTKSGRPNDYPPLFFTLQDFQDVMGDMEMSSRTLKNMTTFEPTPKPRVIVEPEESPVHDLPDTHKGSIHFRVTTTNVPFEKYGPSGWNEGGVGNDDPNHFIFEDYVDRKQKPPQQKPTTKLVLFGDDTFDRDDEDDLTTSTSHTASRVRFLDDFPCDENRPKTPCQEDVVEFDSLQNIDSLPSDDADAIATSFETTSFETKVENHHENEVQDGIFPDEDEFGDVPFDSFLSNAANDSASLYVDQSDNSTSSQTDFQTILVTATVEPVPPERCASEDHTIREVEEVFVEKDVQSIEETMTSVYEDACEGEAAPNNESKSCYSEKPNLTDGGLQKDESDALGPLSGKIEGSDPEKKKIDVDQSLIDFLDSPDRKLEPNAIVHTNYGDEDETKNEDKCSSPDKLPPEDLRRNSFLMNMLQEVENEKQKVVCEVVAIHPKTPIRRCSQVQTALEGRNEEDKKKGEASAAVDAKSKVLDELSSNFSTIRLRPVIGSYIEEVQKQSASDLNIESTQTIGTSGAAGVTGDGDKVAEIKKNYKLNQSLDSVLDSEVVKCKAISEEPIEDSVRSPNEPRDDSKVCSQKTDEFSIDKYGEESISSIQKLEGKTSTIELENEEKNDHKVKFNSMTCKSDKQKSIMNETNNNHKDDSSKERNNNNKNNNVELGSSRRSVNDKCAIVLQCNNNNNDNNAITPVDVSSDQSPNVVSIIPGSVRSFVKFYEIQGETNVGSNFSPTVTDIVTSSAPTVPTIKIDAVPNAEEDCPPKVIQCLRNKSSVSSAQVRIDNDIKYTIVRRKSTLEKQPCNTERDQNPNVNQRTDNFDKSNKPISREPVPFKTSKTDGKKAVHSRCIPVVRSASIDLNGQVKNDADTPRRKESRSRTSPSSKKTPKVMQRTRHGVASGNASGPPQDVSMTGVEVTSIIGDVVRSGTKNHSVPRSPSSTINEHYTFYCTV